MNVPPSDKPLTKRAGEGEAGRLDGGNTAQVGGKKNPNQCGSCRKIEELVKEELNKGRRGNGKLKWKRNVGEVMG